MTDYFTTAFLHPGNTQGKCYTNSLCLLLAESHGSHRQLRPRVQGKSRLPALVLGCHPRGRPSEQSAGEVAALPAQAGRLRVLIEVAGLTEPFAALEAGVRLFSCVHSDVLLAVCQSQESLTADFAGILSSSLHNQDVVL